MNNSLLEKDFFTKQTDQFENLLLQPFELEGDIIKEDPKKTEGSMLDFFKSESTLIDSRLTH